MNEVLFHHFDRNHCCEARYVDEILARLQELTDGSCLVVSSHLETLPASDQPKVVILTGDEGERLSPVPFASLNVRAVFRIFNREDSCNLVNVFPIPPGYNWRMHNEDVSVMDRFYPETPLSQRKTDLFFAGQVIESRRVMVEGLKKLGTSYSTVVGTNPSFRTGLKIDNYLRQLGDTKIALVPDGTSEDTFRYVEAMASGCIVIMPRKSGLWYYEGAPVVWVDSWNELTPGLIRKILSEDLDAWGRRAREYYQTHLSGKAVAEYMVARLADQERPGYAAEQAGRWLVEARKAKDEVRTLRASRGIPVAMNKIAANLHRPGYLARKAIEKLTAYLNRFSV